MLGHTWRMAYIDFDSPSAFSKASWVFGLGCHSGSYGLNHCRRRLPRPIEPPGCHPDSHTRRSDPYILHGIEHRISPQHPMGLDEVTLIVHVGKVPFWYLLPQKPTQGPPPLLDLVFQQSLLRCHAANVVVVLQVLLFTLFAVVIGAEDVPGEGAVGIPDARESRVELREKRPGRPAEDVEEGAVHGGQPGFGIAFVEDDDGVWVGGEEFFGEEGTGDVEDALKMRYIISDGQ